MKKIFNVDEKTLPRGEGGLRCNDGYGDRGDDEVRAVFTTHDVLAKGNGLASLLSDLAAQQVTRLKEPAWAERFEPVTGTRMPPKPQSTSFQEGEPARSLAPIHHGQLFKDTLQMILNGLLAEAQPVRNLLVSQAFSDKLHDLSLSPAQGPRFGSGRFARNSLVRRRRLL